MKFVIKPTRNKQFRVTIVAKNGEVLFTSETYTRKQKAWKVIDVLLEGVVSATGALVEDHTGLKVRKVLR
jgi:uncharacterized protein YegP (UPF0339 family)